MPPQEPSQGLCAGPSLWAPEASGGAPYATLEGEVGWMAGAKRVHLVGIGGAGMSAIARVLLSQGIAVSGSDIDASPVIDELREAGAKVAVGHDPEHVQGVDEVVLSSAIRPDNAEVVEAKRLGIPIRHRSEILADLMEAKVGIAVAGAHGKTTVTSMIAWVLTQLGEEPTFLIGGVLEGLGGARYGAGPALVAEADESDRSFLRYRPRVAVVTTIEPDHLENYDGRFENLKAGYAQFVENVQAGGTAVLGIDDPAVYELWQGVDRRRIHPVGYGLGPTAFFRAADIEMNGFQTSFSLLRDGRGVASVRLHVPGRHNVQNALAALAVCDALGLDLDRAAAALGGFRGAKRRFEVVGEGNGALIIDDYAHHPSEIKATLSACKSAWNRRVVAVFQPHRYSRTQQLLHEFAGAFSEADRLVLTDVYAPPPEEPIPGVSGERLAELVRGELGERVVFAPSLSEVVDTLRREVRPGDIVVTMGAGDVWKAARAFANGE